MATLLLGIGVALIVFGAFVLLRHSDRPGGTLKWFGLEVSSAGAGLPLIALGLGCILFTAFREPGQPSGERSGAAESESSTSTLPDRQTDASGRSGSRSVADTSACPGTLFDSVPADRVARVEAGAADFDVIAPPQPLDAPFGIVFTDNGDRVGAMRIRFYDSNVFKVEAVVDAACGPVDALRNVSRGGDPRALQNWDTIRMRLGEHEYDMRIGGEHTIRLNFSRIS